MNELQHISNVLMPTFSDGAGKTIFCESPHILCYDPHHLFASKIRPYLRETYKAEVAIFHEYLEANRTISDWANGHQGLCFLFSTQGKEWRQNFHLMELLRERKIPFFALALVAQSQVSLIVPQLRHWMNLYYLAMPCELFQLAEAIAKGYAEKLQLVIAHSLPQNLGVDHANAPRILGATSLISQSSGPEVYFGSAWRGRSAVMRLLYDRLERSLEQNMPLFICGEKGVGKSLLATMLHECSTRAPYAFVRVNCREVAASVLEQELFGAYRGEDMHKRTIMANQLEHCHRGTVLIEGADELSKPLQERFIKFFQQRTLDGQLGAKTATLDLKMIFAAEKSAEKLLLEGKFQEEFIHAFGQMFLHIPPLRERKEDLSGFIGHFVQKYSSTNRSNFITFSHASMEILEHYNWPGNVEELELLVHRLVMTRGGKSIVPEDLPRHFLAPKVVALNGLKDQIYLPESGIQLKQLLSELEESIIAQALQRTNGNKYKASQLLGLNRTTLVEKMKKKNFPTSR